MSFSGKKTKTKRDPVWPDLAGKATERTLTRRKVTLGSDRPVELARGVASSERHEDTDHGLHVYLLLVWWDSAVTVLLLLL